MKKSLLKTIAFALVGVCCFSAFGAKKTKSEGISFMEEQENARILNVMAKIRRGEEVRIAAFGGSITTGYASNPLNENSWRALVGKWFQAKADEYGATLRYMNEGVSGTDSAWGAARAKYHLLENKVDLVILEFAMNDQWLESKVRNRSYEGVIRQVEADSDSGVLALYVNERNGVNGQQKEQQPICEYYHIPNVSWKDCEVAKHGDSLDWNKYFDGSETVHPNNEGHAAIASHIIAKLESIWAQLPADDADLPKISHQLPAPKTDAGYEFLTFYSSDNLKPLKNDGWRNSSPVHSEWVAHGNSVEGWSTSQEGAEIVFKVKGTSVNLLYSESDSFRDCEAWAERSDGSTTKKVRLACYQSSRKGYLGWASREIVSGEKEQVYKIHIVCSKARANFQGFETNVCGIIVTHDKKQK